MNRKTKYIAILATSIWFGGILYKIIEYSLFNIKDDLMITVFVVALTIFLSTIMEVTKYIEKNKDLSNKMILWIVAFFTGTGLLILSGFIWLIIYAFFIYQP